MTETIVFPGFSTGNDHRACTHESCSLDHLDSQSLSDLSGHGSDFFSVQHSLGPVGQGMIVVGDDLRPQIIQHASGDDADRFEPNSLAAAFFARPAPFLFLAHAEHPFATPPHRPSNSLRGATRNVGNLTRNFGGGADHGRP